MMDLINRSEVQYKMLEILPEADSLEWYERAKPDEVKEIVDKLYNIVLDAKKVDARPVKHGRWMQLIENGDDYCSICGSRYEGVFPTIFCPCCGAKMYEEEMELTKMNRLSDATLNRMTKKRLIEYVRMCEHNYDIAEETLRQQAENVKDWRPVKHGRWIPMDEYHAKCSVCGWCQKSNGKDDTGNAYIHKAAYKYCTACGAEMNGDADD